VVAYIEIAAALMASEKATVDDVLAYIREALRRASGSGFSGLCAGLTAVAWMAHGREAEGQGALADVSDLEALERFQKSQAVWLPEGLLDAVLGVAFERERSELALVHFRALAASPLGSTSIGKLASRPRARVPAGKAGKRDAK